MAEDPATWGPLERAIHETLAAAGRQRAAGVIGLSTPRLIADELRRRGLVCGEEGGTHADATPDDTHEGQQRHLS